MKGDTPMQLIEILKNGQAAAESLFTRQLLKEDIARLELLVHLAQESADMTAFKKAASIVGWTASDLRTFELNPELGQFLEAAYRNMTGSDISDEQVLGAWSALDRRRMDLLVGCLSRPRID